MNTAIIHRAVPITQVDYVKINGHINLGLLTQHQPYVLTSDHSRTGIRIAEQFKLPFLIYF